MTRGLFADLQGRVHHTDLEMQGRHCDNVRLSHGTQQVDPVQTVRTCTP